MLAYVRAVISDFEEVPPRVLLAKRGVDVVGWILALASFVWLGMFPERELAREAYAALFGPLLWTGVGLFAYRGVLFVVRPRTVLEWKFKRPKFPEPGVRQYESTREVRLHGLRSVGVSVLGGVVVYLRF